MKLHFYQVEETNQIHRKKLPTKKQNKKKSLKKSIHIIKNVLSRTNAYKKKKYEVKKVVNKNSKIIGQQHV